LDTSQFKPIGNIVKKTWIIFLISIIILLENVFARKITPNYTPQSIRCCKLLQEYELTINDAEKRKTNYLLFSQIISKQP